ncbi:MAG: GTPase HflX [Faecalibacillus sp.]
MKAILVMTTDNQFYIDEFISLCSACFIEVTDIVIQKIEIINPATYIGKGKVYEIKKMINDEIVIFNNELSPLQIRNLTDILETKVTDRTDLILQIFEKRAKTKEAKLQVEIARNQYLLPRLIGMQEHMSHQQGGSGFRGSGEKQIELDRRYIARKLSRARRELAQIVKQRQIQRQRRKSNDVPVIALVGYTNSGKSTLMNALTQEETKKVFQKDMLFATLETATRQIKIKNHICLLTDTVGFIERLPHHLIQAFRSTLEEVKEADILLHVVDTSFENYQMQIQTTLDVLKSLGVENTPMIYVYNKIDLDQYAFIQPISPYVFISAKNKIGLDLLENEISHILFKEYEIFEFSIPYEKGEIFKDIHQHCLVKDIQYLDDMIYIKVEAKRNEVTKYSQYLLKH